MSRILGVNARNLQYVRAQNKTKGLRLAKSKLDTKLVLKKAGLPVPKIYGIIENNKDLEDFDWEKLPKTFVVKPNSGFAGSGIVAMVSRKIIADEADPGLEREVWVAANGEEWDIARVRTHTSDILDGNFSVAQIPDIAFFEEKIVNHELIRPYTYKGVPDVRVIVYHNVPVMAMLRLPTRISGGRANLSIGAVGVGIDLASGVTTHGFVEYPRQKTTEKHPDRNIDLTGFEIPFWEDVLEIAVRAQMATGLGYLGVDIAMDKRYGPVIFEINARPGLGIQNANLAPLAQRLERVKGLKVKTVEKGIRLAKELFGGDIERRVEDMSGREVVGIIEPITIQACDKSKVRALAKIDTGASLTAVDLKLLKKLGYRKTLKLHEKFDFGEVTTPEKARRRGMEAYQDLKEEAQHKGFKPGRRVVFIHSSHGSSYRLIVPITFWISGKKIDTKASVATRENLRYPVIIGRKDLKKFLVDPSIKRDRFSHH